MTQNFRIYGYLRASTKEQDATRSRNALLHFAAGANVTISAFFIENESGAKLERPELFRLIDIAQAGDMILVEQVDRISRLKDQDWLKLKAIIGEKKLKIVALDLPTSYQFVEDADEFTNRIRIAINELMLDMLAAVARKDFDDRKRRQREGIAKAKMQGVYQGRRENKNLHQKIELLLSDKKSYSVIMNLLQCSRGTIAKVAKKMKQLQATIGSS